MNKFFNKKKFMSGAFSIGITAVVIALVIVFNIFAAQLPSSIIRPDVTSEKLATVGADSKKILKNVKSDITIYRIYSESYSTASSDGTSSVIPVDTNLTNLLEKYEEACSKIKVKVVDPATNPTFLGKYTSNSLSQNSLVIESDKRSICVDSNDMYLYEIVGYSTGEPMTYEECYSMYQQIYESTYSAPEVVEYFSAENSITGAIDYVISDKIPKVYEITGHGETPLSQIGVSNLTAKENVELVQLSLLSGDTVAVPGDAAAVIMYLPQADIAKEEADALISYVDNGGDLLLYTNAEVLAEIEMKNLNALTSHMGLEAVSKYICEGDANHYYNNNYYIIPTMTGEGVTKDITNTAYYMYAPYSHSISAIEGTEGVTCYPLVNTSKSAFYDTEENVADPEKAEKQTFSLAYQSVTKAGGNLFWFGTHDFINASFLGHANGELYRKILTTTCDKPMSVSIIGKPLTVSVVQRTENMTFMANVLLIGIIPASCLIAGIAVWAVRRKR